MSAAIESSGSAFALGRPVEIFAARGAFIDQWDVTPDGQRFMIAMLPIGEATEPLRVTLNWRPGHR